MDKLLKIQTCKLQPNESRWTATASAILCWTAAVRRKRWRTTQEHHPQTRQPHSYWWKHCGVFANHTRVTRWLMNINQGTWLDHGWTLRINVARANEYSYANATSLIHRFVFATASLQIKCKFHVKRFLWGSHRVVENKLLDSHTEENEVF